MSDIMERFSKKVRDMRQLRGISQEQLALKAGINVSFLGQIERGTKKPTIDTIDKLLEALDISYQEFFDFESNIAQDATIIDKIIYELKPRPLEEQQLIYDLMRKIFSQYS